jgi:hypothetical protein
MGLKKFRAEYLLADETFSPAQVILVQRLILNQLKTKMKIQASIFILFAIAIIGGCKSSTTVVDNTGSLRGNVALVNASGDTLSNYAGATVQIQGTSFQGTSNATGDWEIDNVPAGIYNVSMTKTGFDTLIIPQYQFSGAGTSFLLSNAIQAIPLDSLPLTLTNSGYSELAGFTSNGDSIIIYHGSIGFAGKVSGSDSLEEARVTPTFGAAADTNFNFSQNEYVIGGQLPALQSIPYTKPPVTSGTAVIVRSYLWARITQKTETFTHFQQATSPYSSVQTFIIP